MFAVVITECPAATLVRPLGELDVATVGRLEERVLAAMGGAPSIVVDLADLAFIGVAGLEVLADLTTRARERDIALVVRNATALTMRVLAITGLDEELEVVPASPS